MTEKFRVGQIVGIVKPNEDNRIVTAEIVDLTRGMVDTGYLITNALGRRAVQLSFPQCRGILLQEIENYRTG